MKNQNGERQKNNEIPLQWQRSRLFYHQLKEFRFLAKIWLVSEADLSNGSADKYLPDFMGFNCTWFPSKGQGWRCHHRSWSLIGPSSNNQSFSKVNYFNRNSLAFNLLYLEMLVWLMLLSWVRSWWSYHFCYKWMCYTFACHVYFFLRTFTWTGSQYQGSKVFHP